MNSIETELQHVSLYIRLQNMRYEQLRHLCDGCAG